MVNSDSICKIFLIVSFASILFLFQSCKKMQDYQILKTPFSVIDKLGNSRDYKVYLPEIEVEGKIPLIVYFHGVRSECFKKYAGLKDYTGSPVEETGLIEFCKDNRIALLVPEPRYEYKFLNCICKGWSPFDKEIDGIEKIIDLVVEKYPIEKKRIYLVGLSAGAALTFHLANRRPQYYNAILSHSQGSVHVNLQYLKPSARGPKFGVLLAYTKGDYTNLIEICIKTERIYKAHNYRVILLKDLPPKSHKWSNANNNMFWEYLNKLGQYPNELSQERK